MEWDLNDWKWDGDLFIASSLKNPVPPGNVSRQFFPLGTGGSTSNSSSSCSDDVNLGTEKGKRELDKKGRVIFIDDDNSNDEEAAGTLSLKLGGDFGGNFEKKAKMVGGGGGGASTSRAICQVQDCGVDLSNAKDYHRRHKTCETHSKATKALVGNAMQRFCQQCSR